MYFNKCGRVFIELGSNAGQGHGHRYGSILKIFTHAEDESPSAREDLSIEDLRDLRHLLDRAIANADQMREEFERQRWSRAA